MKKFLLICSFLIPFSLFSNGITVSGISFNSSQNELTFTLEWANSWTYWSSSPALFDAAWVFIKYAPNGGDNWLHAKIVDSIAVPGYIQYISYDDLGLMVYKSIEGSGTFGPEQFTVELDPLLGNYQDFKVFATEMVFIEEGDFNAGDEVSTGRFYANGNVNAPWSIISEAGIIRGDGAGEFNQEGSTATANLSADFPKGWDNIFCMKYKITAQQYLDFLNCLLRAQQENRVKADLSGTMASNKYVLTDTSTPTDRNPIACDVAIGTGCIEFYLDLDESNPPNASNDGGNIVLNHLTPEDILAYLDWSGLRPITELEYEKFCRGEDMPIVQNEYAWGTATYNPIGTITNSGTDAESTSNVGILSKLFDLSPLRAGYAATSTSNRTAASATFYGLMDMHNLGEFMYGVESLQFKWSSYGDGSLSSSGQAEVSDWTTNPQILSSIDPNAPMIEPISKLKTSISFTTRSANMGARGCRKVLSN